MCNGVIGEKKRFARMKKKWIKGLYINIIHAPNFALKFTQTAIIQPPFVGTVFGIRWSQYSKGFSLPFFHFLLAVFLNEGEGNFEKRKRRRIKRDTNLRTIWPTTSGMFVRFAASVIILTPHRLSGHSC